MELCEKIFDFIFVYFHEHFTIHLHGSRSSEHGRTGKLSIFNHLWSGSCLWIFQSHLGCRSNLKAYEWIWNDYSKKCVHSVHLRIKRKLKACCFIAGMEKPPSKHIYEKLNQKLYKMEQITYTILKKITPHVIVWPKFFVSFFMYYRTDLDGEIFELPFIMW